MSAKLIISILMPFAVFASSDEFVKRSGILVSNLKLGTANTELQLSTEHGRLPLEISESLKTQLMGLTGKAVHVFYSDDKIAKIEIPAAAKTHEGILRMGLMGIGGETTGIGLDCEKHGLVELVMDEQMQNAVATKDGKKIKIRGVSTSLSGVTTKDRPAIVVEAIEN